MATFQEGSILGKYELKTLLGKGHFGEVWEASDLAEFKSKQRKSVAIKILTSETLLTLAVSEAKAAFAVRSVYVIRVFDVQVYHGYPSIIMELFPGKSLAEEFKLRSISRRWFSLYELMGLAKMASEALSAIHESTTRAHQDIKPANILFSRESFTLKVTDFGLSEYVRKDSQDMVGTPEYLAPEVVRARSNGSRIPPSPA